MDKIKPGRIKAKPSTPTAATEIGTTKTETLLEKIAEIYSRVGSLKRSGWNDHSKYFYYREDDVFNALRKHMSELGVVAIPSVKREWLEDTVAHCEITMRLVNVDDKEDVIEMNWFGQGRDVARDGRILDKGHYKAVTGAFKQCLLKMFLLSEDDDPENERLDNSENASEKKPAPSATHRQAKRPAPQSKPTPSTPAEAKPKTQITPESPREPEVLVQEMYALGQRNTAKHMPGKYAALSGRLTAVLKTEANIKFLLYGLFKVEEVESLTAGAVDALFTWLRPDSKTNDLHGITKQELRKFFDRFEMTI